MAKANDTTVSKGALAETIMNMSYGELLKIGDQLSTTKHQRLEAAEDFAKLLYNWAESQ